MIPNDIIQKYNSLKGNNPHGYNLFNKSMFINLCPWEGTPKPYTALIYFCDAFCKVFYEFMFICLNSGIYNNSL